MVRLGIDFVTGYSELCEVMYLPHQNTHTTLQLYFVWNTNLRGP